MCLCPCPWMTTWRRRQRFRRPPAIDQELVEEITLEIPLPASKMSRSLRAEGEILLRENAEVVLSHGVHRSEAQARKIGRLDMRNSALGPANHGFVVNGVVVIDGARHTGQDDSNRKTTRDQGKNRSEIHEAPGSNPNGTKIKQERPTAQSNGGAFSVEPLDARRVISGTSPISERRKRSL